MQRRGKKKVGKPRLKNTSKHKKKRRSRKKIGKNQRRVTKKAVGIGIEEYIEIFPQSFSIHDFISL